MAKDFPLMLKRRRDSSLVLMSDQFPPRHEFSVEWLLESGVAQMDEVAITVTLANGTATYEIDRGAMEETYEDDDGETKTRRLSTGYWGNLVDAEVHEAPPVDEVEEG